MPNGLADLTESPSWITDYYGEIAGKHIAVEWDLTGKNSPVLIFDGGKRISLGGHHG